MTEYDLELIIDKEGTEGLAKVYESLYEEFAETPINKLGFLEKDFAYDYFNARINESLNHLNLTSLFERDASGYDEDVKTRFKRKEALCDDMGRADEIFTKTVDYYKTSTSSYMTKEKAMLHLQALDHCLDVLTFKHSLDLISLKGYAKKVQEPDVAKVIGDYGSVLKTYIENKKFNNKLKGDKLRILNKSLNDTISNCLEDILSSYKIDNEQLLKRFQALKDRVLENKETSFMSMFEDGKRYGWFYVKNTLEAVCGLPFLFGGAAFYIGCVLVAVKEGAFFSNYIVGGALGAIIYLTVKYYNGFFSIAKNIDSKINQALINKNERLKEAVINKKKSFSEPLP